MLHIIPFINKFCLFVLCNIARDKHGAGGRATAASCFLIDIDKNSKSDLKKKRSSVGCGTL